LPICRALESLTDRNQQVCEPCVDGMDACALKTAAQEPVAQGVDRVATHTVSESVEVFYEHQAPTRSQHARDLAKREQRSLRVGEHAICRDGVEGARGKRQVVHVALVQLAMVQACTMHVRS